tara:strand:- start:232 stop:1119 length:888 start_codon:yes stop_codon:yes gene_type:complete
MKKSKYLEPELLSKLQNLSIKAKYVVEGFMIGLHKSPYHGFSVEFSEHRPYGFGDEVRHIDWKLWSKTDKYYVKQFEEETNLKAHIILDQSRSMDYGSSEISKFEYSKLLAASFAYILIKQQDAVGLALFDEQINKLIPPKSIPSHLNILLSHMEQSKPGSKTNIAKALHHSAEGISKRGLVIVISDFMDDPNAVMGGLRHLRHKGHEVIVFHVLDKYELNFDFNERIKFIDKETGDEITTDPWHITKQYNEHFKQHCDFIKHACGQNKIEYIQLQSNQALDIALSELLLKRKNY